MQGRCARTHRLSERPPKRKQRSMPAQSYPSQGQGAPSGSDMTAHDWPISETEPFGSVSDRSHEAEKMLNDLEKRGEKPEGNKRKKKKQSRRLLIANKGFGGHSPHSDSDSFAF